MIISSDMPLVKSYKTSVDSGYHPIDMQKQKASTAQPPRNSDYVDISGFEESSVNPFEFLNQQSSASSKGTHSKGLSLANFKRQLINYLENQDMNLSVSYDTASDMSAGALNPIMSFGAVDPMVLALNNHSSTTATLNNGTQVTISLSNNGANIELSLPDGQKLSVQGITTNVRFTPADNGEILMVTDSESVTFDAKGNRKSESAGANPLAGTSGNDIIINFRGSEISGGEGDDLIINYARQANISGGAGNDKVIIVNNDVSKLDIDLGDGDDSLEMADAWPDSEINISGGKGNDNITIGSASGSSLNINGGEGNDKIIITDHIHVENAQINGNAGDDTITINNVFGIHGRPTTIDAGDGNNTVSVNFLHAGNVKSGKGNDIIKIGTADYSIIDGGDGDNEITVGELFRSLLINGDGNDIISIDSMLHSIIASRETAVDALWDTANATSDVPDQNEVADDADNSEK